MSRFIRLTPFFPSGTYTVYPNGGALNVFRRGHGTAVRNLNNLPKLPRRRRRSGRKLSLLFWPSPPAEWRLERPPPPRGAARVRQERRRKKKFPPSFSLRRAASSPAREMDFRPSRPVQPLGWSSSRPAAANLVTLTPRPSHSSVYDTPLRQAGGRLARQTASRLIARVPKC